MQQTQDIEHQKTIDSLDYLYLKHRQFIQYFFDNFNYHQCLPLIEKLLCFQGSLFFSGMGKSSFVARKVAATFMSLGQKATFLSVEHAFHGDIGSVYKNDIVCFLSKSGETQELLDLVPGLKERGAYVCAFTSNTNSELAKVVDTHIFLPCVKELCPYNLIPTISTQIQLMVGDLITASFFSLKQIPLKKYASNHPKGFIGKKTSMLVQDVMLTLDQVPLCFAEDKVDSVLPILSEKGCGCVLIVNHQEHLVGIFTDGDLRRALQHYGKAALDFSIGSLMNADPKILYSYDLAWLALIEMERERSVTVLPVLSEDEKLVGLIRMHDLVKLGLV